jgi:hypothetical protein
MQQPAGFSDLAAPQPSPANTAVVLNPTTTATANANSFLMMFPLVWFATFDSRITASVQTFKKYR